jgi:hypothetical protein
LTACGGIELEECVGELNVDLSFAHLYREVKFLGGPFKPPIFRQ